MPKAKSKSLRNWIVGVVTALLISGATGFLVYATDTLRAVVTTDSLEKVLRDKGLTAEQISERIRLESTGSTVNLENTVKNVDEIKQDFKDFKKDQDEKLKEFQDAQLEMMKLMIRMNAKLEKDS